MPLRRARYDPPHARLPAEQHRLAPPLESLPGGSDFAARMDQVPEHRRHLELHRGHLVEPNAHDRAVLTGEFIERATLTGTPEQLRARLSELESAGATEIAYQPAGPDIPRELRAFGQMAGLSG